MDPLALATMVVSVIAPYLAKAGEVVAKKAGEAAWGKVSELFVTLQEKLTGDTYAEQTLNRLEEDPESESRQAALVGVLEEQIKDDADFARALERLLAEAKEAVAETITQQVTVFGSAKTGDITQIGKIEGSVDIGSKE